MNLVNRLIFKLNFYLNSSFQNQGYTTYDSYYDCGSYYSQPPLTPTAPVPHLQQQHSNQSQQFSGVNGPYSPPSVDDGNSNGAAGLWSENGGYQRVKPDPDIGKYHFSPVPEIFMAIRTFYLKVTLKTGSYSTVLLYMSDLRTYTIYEVAMLRTNFLYFENRNRNY